MKGYYLAGAFVVALGLSSNLYAADPAKVKQAMDIAENTICFRETNQDRRCRRRIVIREEGHHKGILEITGVVDVVKGEKSFIMGRVSYSPITRNYWTLQFDDGNAKDGIAADGSLDKVLTSVSPNKDGPQNIFEVLLKNPDTRQTHDDIFTESLDQFISAAQQK